MRPTDLWRNLILGLFVLQLLADHSQAAQSYTAQDLGFDDAIKAVGPNFSGQAAVRSGFVEGRSFLVTADAIAGVITDGVGLLPGGDQTTANAINDLGIVVGSANAALGSAQCRPNIPSAPTSGSCPISAVRPAIWTKTGALVDLGTLPGDNAGEAFGINKSGAVVGYSGGPDGIHAFVWTANNGMRNLGALLAGFSSKAFAISDNGLIVGSSDSPMGTHAVLWGPSGIQDLGTLPGDTASEAYAVNNAGSVVGYSRGIAGLRAFLWTSQSGMQRLDPLPGAAISQALSINDRGDIVGLSGSFDGPRAVLWASGGSVQDLNVLVSLPPGVILSQASGINAKGQIMVSVRNELDAHKLHEGFNRVFLLTPGGP